MISRNTILSASIVAVLVCLPMAARAQTIPDQPVYLTFSGPVSVPNATLPAGKYMFKLASGRNGGDTVQIYDAQGKAVVMAMAIPAIRSNGEPVPEKPEVNFYETAPGVPQAVKIWWYPGIRSGGHEFVYPRAQAQRIAKATKSEVLTSADNDNSGKFVRMSASGETEVVNPAAASAPPEPVPAPTQMAMNQAPPPPVPAPPTPRSALPKTASEMPVVAMVGLLSLFAGLMLRRRVA